jgi:hypothetical protein
MGPLVGPMEILLLLLFCHSLNCSPIKSQLPKTYAISSIDNTHHRVKVINGYSIHQLFQTYLCPLLSHDECYRFMDQASEDYYGISYTPSRLTSTIEDYYSTHTDLLKYLLHRFPSSLKRYLEIGCQEDINFNQIKPLVESAVGVDPISGGTHRLTSDGFFLQNSQHYDLIFIDGDHTAFQVWRDIKNSLLVLSDEGFIVIHDLNPRLRDRSEHLNTTVWLNSDGWKAAIAMRFTQDYDIVVVDIDHGCGIIRKRTNHHRLSVVLEDAVLSSSSGISELVTEGLVYEDLEKYREDFFRLMSLVEMREWLEEKKEVEREAEGSGERQASGVET